MTSHYQEPRQRAGRDPALRDHVRRIGLLLVLVPIVLCFSGAGLPPGQWPLDGPVVTDFDAPNPNWHSGHRGVDLGGHPGDVVVAAAAGRVVFAGSVAGRSVISIDHGEVRTTYEPVSPTVRVGDRLRGGDPIGVLDAGHDCSAPACLHWGLRSVDGYRDPRDLLGTQPQGEVRMLPGGSRERAEAASKAREESRPDQRVGTASPPGEHGFIMPVNGPITSPFGMRVHPITGVYKLHDGTDWGASCGSPIVAPYPGTVVGRTSGGAWGERLVLDHGVVDGRAVRTSYNHAISYAVGLGQQVEQGDVIGKVGTTGYSTGCHLHLQLWLDGGIVDPMTWF